MTIARFPVPPIVKTVKVRCAPSRAFALFAEDFARWWPLSRVHTGPDPVDCAIEPRVGGRVFERAADGRETPWGTVLAYDPPHRLAFSWVVELAAGQEQLVEIRFTAEDSGTRVELTHSGWENSATPPRASASATTAAGAPSSSAILPSTSIPLRP